MGRGGLLENKCLLPAPHEMIEDSQILSHRRQLNVSKERVSVRKSGLNRCALAFPAFLQLSRCECELLRATLDCR